MSRFEDARILLVGAGRMGGALLAGWLARGAAGERLTVVDPEPSAETETLIRENGVTHVALEDARGPFDAVVIAVKPQTMAAALPSLAPFMSGETVAASVAAGTTLAALGKGLGEGRAIVRAMPNLPASIGCGMTVACANAAVSPDGRALVDSILSAVGRTAWIDDESLMDAVTAVSGSGPAYVFLLAECMAEAGIAAGLPPDLAATLARETVAGAGALLGRSSMEPARLRESVTSPGGTTAAALRVLMKESGLRPLMQAAVKAAAERSRDLQT